MRKYALLLAVPLIIGCNDGSKEEISKLEETVRRDSTQISKLTHKIDSLQKELSVHPMYRGKTGLYENGTVNLSDFDMGKRNWRLRVDSSKAEIDLFSSGNDVEYTFIDEGKTGKINKFKEYDTPPHNNDFVLYVRDKDYENRYQRLSSELGFKLGDYFYNNLKSVLFNQ